MNTRFIFIIGLFLISVNIVFAQNLTVKVEPQQLTVENGESFSVSILIENVSNLGSFQFDLVYKTSVVHADAAQMGALLGGTGRTVIPAGPTIDNSSATGKLTFGGATFGTQNGPNGNGALASITFTSKGDGSTALELKNVQVSDINGQTMTIHSIISGLVNVGEPADDRIILDGYDTDWLNVPVACSASNNQSNYFPTAVTAAITDRVDIKEVKAIISEDTLYFFMSFWGGPVWPNFCVQAGNKIYNRGYYHLLLDLDNNPQTGWNTHWYEGHLTTVGYFNSQGHANTDPIGAEAYFMLGLRTDFYPPTSTGSVNLFAYMSADVRAVDPHQPPTPHPYIFDLRPANPDTNDLYLFNGQGDDFVANDGSSAWCGHAWGNTFLEYGVELKKFTDFWRNNGYNFLNSGDRVGIAGFIETPIDDWGTDFSPRGEVEVISGNSTFLGKISQPAIPTDIRLLTNYPNPFNPETMIEYHLPYTANVQVSIYNLQGQQVRMLAQGAYSPGQHTVKWNGRDNTGNRVSSGVYFYKLTVNAIDKNEGKFVQMKKMMLLK